MNKLTIPPSPNWYASNILACASDNTIIYGSRCDVIIIYPAPPDQAAEVKILRGIHNGRVNFISVNENWGNPNKWAVSVSDDNTVQLLDVASCTSKISHVGHKTHGEKIVGAVFSGEDKVVSVSEKGFVIVWKISTNNLTPVQTLVPLYLKFSTISSCPHAPWIIAFGLKKGGIIITDMKKSGKVLYKINAHEDEVVSLSWCPAPYNVIPSKTVKIKSQNKIVITIKTPTPTSTSDKNESTPETISTTAPLIEGTDVPINIETTNTELEIEEVNVLINDSTDSKLSSEKNQEVKSNLSLIIGQPKIKNEDTENRTVKEDVNNPDLSKIVSKRDYFENVGAVGHVVSTQLHNGSDCKDSVGSNAILETVTSEKVEDAIKESIETNEDSISNPSSIIGELDVEIEDSNNETVLENVSKSVLPDTALKCDEHVVDLQVHNGSDDNDSLGSKAALETVNNENMEDAIKEPIQVNADRDILSVIPTPDSSPEDVKLPEVTIISTHTMNNENQIDVDSVSTEYLLASSARGSRSIKIWRAKTDGLLQTELFLPVPYNQRSHKSNDKPWIVVCWATPTDLLCSSKKGQLLLWKLNSEAKKDSGKGNFRYRTIHADHSKYIFCIAIPKKLYETISFENWRDSNMLNAWTVGNDRFLLNTSLGAENKNLASYSTVGATISCLIPSPIDPTRVACGMNDGCSKIWDLSQPHLQKVILTPLSEKHSFKVSSFAWHPTKENCLAYGTSDGQVGLLDPNSSTKAATQLVQSSLSAVYHLQWGPIDGNTGCLGLYVLSNGKLVVYDIKRPLHEPTTIECCVDNYLSAFAWKSDYSLLAVASKDHELSLYNTDCKLVDTFLLQTKTVRYLAWHSIGTPEENWLAMASNQVIVFDCSTKETDSASKYDKCAVAIFTNHIATVHCVTWSPHQSEILASVGEDGCAMVWNAKTKALLHTCHTAEILYSVLWSPFDPDYILTGGKGCAIRIWKLSENPPQQKLEKVQRKLALTLKPDQDDEDVVTAKAEGKSKRTARCFLNGVAQLHNVQDPALILQDCQQLFAEIYSKNDCALENKTSKLNEKLSILKLFGGKDEIAEILELEKANHLNRTTVLSLESVSLWQGDIGETIRNAIKSESLNSWLISVAPMVSYNLWQEACEAYAKQVMNSRPVEAAYYYLACHKVEESIEALRLGLYFREALILAKCRLSPTDPIINSIIEDWAKYSVAVGKFEIAAQCYLSLHKLEEAAKVLFRRSDVPTLELCVKFAEETGNKDLLNATLFRLNAFKLDSSDSATVPLESRLELELMKLIQNEEKVNDTENKTEKDE